MTVIENPDEKGHDTGVGVGVGVLVGGIGVGVLVGVAVGVFVGTGVGVFVGTGVGVNVGVGVGVFVTNVENTGAVGARAGCIPVKYPRCAALRALKPAIAPMAITATMMPYSTTSWAR